MARGAVARAMDFRCGTGSMEYHHHPRTYVRPAQRTASATFTPPRRFTFHCNVVIENKNVATGPTRQFAYDGRPRSSGPQIDRDNSFTRISWRALGIRCTSARNTFAPGRQSGRGRTPL